MRGSKTGQTLGPLGTGELAAKVDECGVHHRFGCLEGRHAPQGAHRQKTPPKMTSRKQAGA